MKVLRHFHINASSACHKCALLQVIKFRFMAFKRAFGRIPAQDEPLFFDPAKELPVRASSELARKQVALAARAMGVEVEPVLRALKLVPTKAVRARTTKGPSAWDKFKKNHLLHRRYGIIAAELETLSEGIAMFGKTASAQDFLFMLSVIRKRSRSENHSRRGPLQRFHTT